MQQDEILSTQRVRQEGERALQITQETLQESQALQHATIQHYEGLLAELNGENNQLRTRISHLEEQVSRLSDALVGNRSHFAKYVEVKTENLALQCRLESIAKAIPSKYQGAMGALEGSTKLSPRLLPHINAHGNNIAPNSSGPGFGPASGPSISNQSEIRRKPFAGSMELSSSAKVASSSRPPLVPSLAAADSNVQGNGLRGAASMALQSSQFSPGSARTTVQLQSSASALSTHSAHSASQRPGPQPQQQQGKLLV
jgi:hypothetical protein